MSSNTNAVDYTDGQVSAVAFIIVTEREKVTDAGWNRGATQQVILDELAQGRTLDGILGAGLAAALDVSAKTPKAIGFDKYRPSARPGTGGAASPEREHGPFCDECGFTERKHTIVVGNGSYFPHGFAVVDRVPSAARRFHLGAGERP